MGKIEIIDDCLSPAKYIYLTYNGKNPYGVAQKIGGMLSIFFKVSGSGWGEPEFKWDVVGDNNGFFLRWWVEKKFSMFSTAYFNMKVQGEAKKSDNTGYFNLEVYGILKTTFKYSSPITKAFWFLYSHLFYHRARRRFIEICRDFTLDFRNEMKEHYNLEISQEFGER